MKTQKSKENRLMNTKDILTNLNSSVVLQSHGGIVKMRIYARIAKGSIQKTENIISLKTGVIVKYLATS